MNVHNFTFFFGTQKYIRNVHNFTFFFDYKKYIRNKKTKNHLPALTAQEIMEGFRQNMARMFCAFVYQIVSMVVDWLWQTIKQTLMGEWQSRTQKMSFTSQIIVTFVCCLLLLRVSRQFAVWIYPCYKKTWVSFTVFWAFFCYNYFQRQTPDKPKYNDGTMNSHMIWMFLLFLREQFFKGKLRNVGSMDAKHERSSNISDSLRIWICVVFAYCFWWLNIDSILGDSNAKTIFCVANWVSSCFVCCAECYVARTMSLTPWNALLFSARSFFAVLLYTNALNSMSNNQISQNEIWQFWYMIRVICLVMRTFYDTLCFSFIFEDGKKQWLKLPFLFYVVQIYLVCWRELPLWDEEKCRIGGMSGIVYHDPAMTTYDENLLDILRLASFWSDSEQSNAEPQKLFEPTDCQNFRVQCTTYYTIGACLLIYSFPYWNSRICYNRIVEKSSQNTSDPNNEDEADIRAKQNFVLDWLQDTQNDEGLGKCE